MIELKPKQVFQAHESIKKELAVVTTSDNFQFALSFALAEFVSRSNPNADQLAAVRGFIGVLLNLPLAEEPLPVFPVKTLSYPAQPK
jgi:hypothetical protein